MVKKGIKALIDKLYNQHPANTHREIILEPLKEVLRTVARARTKHLVDQERFELDENERRI